MTVCEISRNQCRCRRKNSVIYKGMGSSLRTSSGYGPKIFKDNRNFKEQEVDGNLLEKLTSEIYSSSTCLFFLSPCLMRSSVSNEVRNDNEWDQPNF